MTPFVKGKSDEIQTLFYYFKIDKRRASIDQIKNVLEDYKFKTDLKHDKKDFDFVMSIRLETHYNSTKFARDLMKKYQFTIKEIKVEER